MSDYKRIIAGKKARAAGEYFEQMITTACMWYEDQGLSYIKKTPEPMKPLSHANEHGQFKACFTERAEPDYKGTLRGGGSIVFEAKHTDKDKIERSRVSETQQEALEKHWNLGAAAFVLVSIQLFDFYRIPWPAWRDMVFIYNRRHMKLGDLKPYKIPVEGGRIMLLDGINDYLLGGIKL